MVILSSPSGAGKTTLVKLLSERKGFVTSISHTTRTPRSNEVDGVDYYFITKSKFEELINKKKFYEYAKIFDNYYGTLKENVDETIKENETHAIEWGVRGKISKVYEKSSYSSG